MSALLAAALLAGSVTAAPAPEPYFGHRGAACGTPDPAGASMGGLAVEPSPVPPRASRLIRRFEAAAAAGRSTAAFVDAGQLSIPTRLTCTAAIARLRSARSCRPTPLYLLGDGEIREEWLCGGRMVYLLFFTVEEGRITNLWAMDSRAVPPVIVTVPSRP